MPFQYPVIFISFFLILITMLALQKKKKKAWVIYSMSIAWFNKNCTSCDQMWHTWPIKKQMCPIHFSIGNRCDVKLFKSIDCDCILFHLLWFNTFGCVYFMYCCWEHKAMFIACFIFYCMFYLLWATNISFFFFG